jgi:hypothetical protein
MKNYDHCVVKSKRTGGIDLLRIWQNRKGLSTIIVVALGLIILVTIVVNIFLWNYEMNQFDWEKTNEDMEIIEVTSVTNSSWFVAQSEYALNAGCLINGTFADTQFVDDHYESFTEGLNWWNVNYSYRRQISIINNAVVTLTSDYSIQFTLDTASIISTGKMLSNGEDLRIIYWDVHSWIELDRDILDVNTNSTQIWFRLFDNIPNGMHNDDYHIYYGNPTAGEAPKNKSNVYLWFDDFNRLDTPDITTESSYNTKTGGGAWSIETNKLKNVGASGDPNKLIITDLNNVTDVDMLVKINVTSFAGGDLSRMGLSCCMDSDPSPGSGYCCLFHDDTNSLDLLNDLRSWGTRRAYGWSLNTWYYMRFRVIDPVNKTGKIKVWQAGSVEPSIWTVEGDFGSGAARNHGEIGFAGSRAADIAYFDDILIRQVVSSEPSTTLGSEESQGDNRFDGENTLVVDVSKYPLTDIQTIEIQIRFKASVADESWYLQTYNWSSSTYSDDGFNSTSGYVLATEWAYYAVNLSDQWNDYIHDNGTLCVKLLDEGTDGNQTTVDIDFLAVRAVIDGTEFTFRNQGSLTLYLVSLWVNNSTHHLRYDMNVFINAGDKESYIRIDIPFPTEPFVVKVVSERGNIAIYSTG